MCRLLVVLLSESDDLRMVEPHAANERTPGLNKGKAGISAASQASGVEGLYL